MKISSVSKKVLASALSAAMVVAFAPAAAFAVETPVATQVAGKTYVAKVTLGSTNTNIANSVKGDVYYYESLAEAVGQAEAGDAITLLSDVAIADVESPSINVLKAVADKYTQQATSLTLATGVSFDGAGHTISIETVEAYTGSDPSANVVAMTANDVDAGTPFLTIGNGDEDATTGAAVKNLSIVDNTNVSATSVVERTANANIAIAATALKTPEVKANTGAVSVPYAPALAVTGVTANSIAIAGGNVDDDIELNATAKIVTVGDTASGKVKVVGGTYEQIDARDADNTVEVAGGTVTGAVDQLASTSATMATPADGVYKLPKTTAASGLATVYSWDDEAKHTYFTDTYKLAIYGATANYVKVTGGDIKGYVSKTDIKGGNFAIDPLKIYNTGGNQVMNTVPNNYAQANGAFGKGVQTGQVAFNGFSLTPDSDAVYSTTTGALLQPASTATTDSKKNVAAAATAVVKGLATDSKLYKEMYTDGDAATITVAKTATPSYVPASRAAALTAEQIAANAKVEGAYAAAVAGKYAGVEGITYDAKKAAITAGNVNEVTALLTAGAATTVKTGAEALAEFGTVYETLTLGAGAATYTSAALLYSADGTNWEVAQALDIAKVNTDYKVSYAVSKAGFYAIAYSNAANDAAVKAAEEKAEAEKKAEEAAAEAQKQLIATQDKAAVNYVNSTKTKTVKLSKAKKQKTTITCSSKVSASGNAVIYAKKSGSSKIKIAASGKATLAKVAKKGTYTAKIKVTCGEATRTVTAKFVVK